MRCLICESNDWENVDEHRVIEKGMSICKNCGFVSYPSLWKSEEDIKKYYQEDYRKPPIAGNLFSGQRKLYYHEAFLAPLFKEWREKKRENIVVGEIGSAYGMFLNWVKSFLPDAEMNGVELTKSYKRVAYHEYGLDLKDDFDKTKKYDLICSYKVAEHQLDIDKRLREYVECLKEDGLMYVSVPTWFGAMTNFGIPGFDIEYYYHTNHINVWTRKLFETLLNKVGLEIIKEDHIMYDDTYLCKRNDKLMKIKPIYEDPKEIKDRLARIKKAAEFFQDGKYIEANQVWPNFPDSCVNTFEMNRKELFAKGWDSIKKEYIGQVEKICPEAGSLNFFFADIAMRFEKFNEALEYIDKGLKAKPNDSQGILMSSHVFRQMSMRASDPKQKNELMNQSLEAVRHLRSSSLQSLNESTTWIYDDESQIPTPFEEV